MARTTTKGLYVWDLSTDAFNHVQLAANWDLVESYWVGFDSGTKLPKRINTSATVPVGGTAGDVVMLTATTGGYDAYTIMRYDGTNWRPVGLERLASVPVAGNFAGRVVMLTTANGGFNAYDLIKYDGSGWSIVGGFGASNTGGGSGNIVGPATPDDIHFTNGGRGPVLTDRTTGLFWRLYISGANIHVERVT
jgi:hypothetical protein